MAKQSAGLLLYRRRPGAGQVFLVHPGGPFWAKKDVGAWSIPKGEFEAGEDPLSAARRELAEETGFRVPGPFTALGTVRISGGKTLHAFAAEADVDADRIVSNVVTIEWPPRSGRTLEFPEVDRAAWFSPEEAREKIHASQVPFLERAATLLTPP